jgi:sortase A
MKVTVPRRSIRRFLRWTQAVSLVTAVGLLGYCSIVWMDSWNFQAEASRAFDQAHFQPASLPGSSPAATAGVPATAMNGLVGRMEIPRLGMSIVIAEGTTGRTLRRAAGHIAGTSLPGETGNIGISGHRDTFFRPLRNIAQDDVIMLTTLQGAYRYRVVSMKVVNPEDVTVLDSDGSEILTLVTCYPFYFVGPAPGRFIVRAKRTFDDQRVSR